MLRLHVVGPHTSLVSSLCADCPHSPAGCCVAPPDMDWSDVGRVVALGGEGGLDWLEREMASRNLVPTTAGLRLRKTKAVAREGAPKLAKCVYHTQAGCRIAAERRPATCNYYVCESVYADDAAHAPSARLAHAALARTYAAWDEEIATRVTSLHPEGAPWDRAFFVWLGAVFEELAARDGAALPRTPH